MKIFQQLYKLIRNERKKTESLNAFVSYIIARTLIVFEYLLMVFSVRCSPVFTAYFCISFIENRKQFDIRLFVCCLTIVKIGYAIRIHNSLINSFGFGCKYGSDFGLCIHTV